MKVRPLTNLHFIGYPQVRLDSSKTYEAVPATNQPEPGGCFILTDTRDVLLVAGEFEVVE